MLSRLKIDLQHFRTLAMLCQRCAGYIHTGDPLRLETGGGPVFTKTLRVPSGDNQLAANGRADFLFGHGAFDFQIGAEVFAAASGDDGAS